MEMIFYSHDNKTHFHKKGCAPSLILEVRVFGTRKLPIKRMAYLALTHTSLISSVKNKVLSLMTHIFLVFVFTSTGLLAKDNFS